MAEPYGPDVTICIPAYRSAAFIGRTLEAVSAQTYGNFRAIVSVDGEDPATEDVCRHHADLDTRFEVMLQPVRLGWLGNTNALFDKVTTEFFCIMPHDDFIMPAYLEKLRGAALAHPEALVVYCDMERIGVRRHDSRSTPNLDGDFRSRLAAVLTAPTEAVAWRGLTRASVLAGGRRMRPNAFENYNAHALWVLELLCLGPFRHVPGLLYCQWERVDEGSVTTGWRSLSPELRYAAMAEYILQAIEIVSTLGNGKPADRQAIVALLLFRLLNHPSARSSFPPRASSPDRFLIRAAELLGRMNGLPYLGAAEAEALRDDGRLHKMMAQLRVRDAKEAFAADDATAASAALASAAAMDPDNGEIHLRLSQVFRREGKVGPALEAVEGAARLLPENAAVRIEHAKVMVLGGRFEEAAAFAKDAIRIDPNWANGHFHLSRALTRCRRIAEALAALEAALSLEPDEPKFLAHRQSLRRLLEAAAAAGGAAPEAETAGN